MAVLRILLSSPGDVAEERQKARQVIEHLQRYYGSRVTLVPVLWENLPLGADASFQEGIDVVLTEKHRIDIAVFILWSRLGSPVRRPSKPDGTPYRSGTEREFDLMLEARRRSGGKHPHIIAYMRDDDAGFRRALTTAPGNLLKEIAEQHSLVHQFIEERFEDELGRNQRAYHTYDRPLTFASRLKMHLRAIIDDMLGEASSGAAVWDECPYRGLQVFDIQHAPIFFGREQEVCEVELLLRRRAETGNAFVVIVGSSGSGKSSLARAGIAANLLHANLDDSVKEWRLAMMQPGGLQGDVFGSLVRALADSQALKELSGGGPDALERFRDSLAESPQTALSLKFTDALNRAAETAGGPVKILLLVDQLEELWTDKQIGPEQRDAFLRVLSLMAAGGHAWVIATLRADIYPLALQCQPFVQIKRGPKDVAGCEGIFELFAPDPAALHRLIKEPAILAGLRFEKDDRTARSLDQILLRDAIGHPDALPLIEYALQQLFEARTDDGCLTFAAYEKIGGFEKALGLQAEATFAALPPDVHAEFPHIIRTLVAVATDAQGQALRRTTPLSTITDTETKKTFTDAFVSHRFFTTDRENDAPVVRIAHEALLRRWDRLAKWIADNHEHLRLLSRVEQSCARWLGSGKHASLLLPEGLPLEEAKKLSQEDPALIASELAAFITQSVDFHLEQARRRGRTRRIWVAALATLAVLAIGGAGWAMAKRREAIANARLAQEQSAAQKKLLAEYSENDRCIAFDLAAQGKCAEALAYCARSLTSNPENLLAAQQTFMTVMYGAGPRWRIPVSLEPVDSAPAASPYAYRFVGPNLVITDVKTKTNLWPPAAFAPTIRKPNRVIRSDNFRLLAVSDGSRTEIYDPLSAEPTPVVIRGIVACFATSQSNNIAVVRFDTVVHAVDDAAHQRDAQATATSTCWRIVNLSRNLAIDIEPSAGLFRSAKVKEAPNPAEQTRRSSIRETASIAFAKSAPVAGVLFAGRAGFVDLVTGETLCIFDDAPPDNRQLFQISDDGQWAAVQAADGSFWYYDLTGKTPTNRKFSGDIVSLAVCQSNNIAVVRFEFEAVEHATDDATHGGDASGTDTATCWRIVNMSRNLAIDIEPSAGLFRSADAMKEPIRTRETRTRPTPEEPTISFANASPVAGVLYAGRAGFVDMTTGRTTGLFEEAPRGKPQLFQIADDGQWAGIQAADGSILYYDLEDMTSTHKHLSRNARLIPVREPNTNELALTWQGRETASAPKSLSDEPYLLFARESKTNVIAYTRAGTIIAFDPSSTNEPHVIFAEMVGEIVSPSLDTTNRMFRFNSDVNRVQMRCCYDVGDADESPAGDSGVFACLWNTSFITPELPTPPTRYRTPPNLYNPNQVFSRNAVGYEIDAVTGEYVTAEIDPWSADPGGRYLVHVLTSGRHVDIWHGDPKKRIYPPIPYAVLHNLGDGSGLIVKTISSSSDGRVRISIVNAGDIVIHLPPVSPPGGMALPGLWGDYFEVRDRVYRGGGRRIG